MTAHTAITHSYPGLSIVITDGSPHVTPREADVLFALCQPALTGETFTAPATAREIARDLVVTEAAVKQHLIQLYSKFRIGEGPNRRARLANEVMQRHVVRRTEARP